MKLDKFIPHVFISIGRDCHYFTLRQTQLRVVGRGKMVQSFHVKNLSQDPDEAIELAREYADANGMLLKTERYELPDSLEDIQRRRHEEVARVEKERERAAEAKKQRLEEAKRERRAYAENQIKEGILPFGMHRGDRFLDHPDYCRFLMSKREEFEPDSILAFFCDYLEKNHPELMPIVQMWRDAHLDVRVGQRVNIEGTVIDVKTFANDWGVTRYVTLSTDDRICVLAKGKWYAPVGKRVNIVATVKEKGEYKGVKQTVVNRVKER